MITNLVFLSGVFQLSGFLILAVLLLIQALVHHRHYLLNLVLHVLEHLSLYVCSCTCTKFMTKFRITYKLSITNELLDREGRRGSPTSKFSRSESKAEVSGCIFQPDIDMNRTSIWPVGMRTQNLF